MASLKKLGQLIRAARTDAGLTQEQLARKVKNCAASDISKAERGEKALTTDQLKQIAKATGVTQKSLLDAAKGTGATGTSSSSSSASKTSMKVSSTERRLVELYRAADSQTKKNAMSVLKGEGVQTLVGSLVSSAINAVTGKREMPAGDDADEEE